LPLLRTNTPPNPLPPSAAPPTHPQLPPPLHSAEKEPTNARTSAPVYPHLTSLLSAPSPTSFCPPPQSADEKADWCVYEYTAAAWGAFSSLHQAEHVLPLARLAAGLPTLGLRAPRACAAAHLVVFTHALGLSHLGQAHAALRLLDTRASDPAGIDLSAPANAGSYPEEDFEQGEYAEGSDPAAAEAARARLFSECRADCLNTLVSVLHERRQMAKLARLPFEGGLRMHLVDTLRRHAPNSDVVITPQGATVYEVLYALQVRVDAQPQPSRNPLLPLPSHQPRSSALRSAGAGGCSASA
jgi:hypothetical protein